MAKKTGPCNAGQEAKVYDHRRDMKPVGKKKGGKKKKGY